MQVKGCYSNRRVLLLGGLRIYATSGSFASGAFRLSFTCIVYAEEFCRTGNHVNIVMFSLGLLFVHKAKDRILQIRELESDAADLKQRPAQMG